MRCNGDINSVLDLLVLKCCGALKKKMSMRLLVQV